ncbi:MAG TPA: hypothetical protein VJ841_03495 [Candidatus Saccharimonadales bacterium]|nr:hypothetical protein [Candidatus Saccharimonadales bacterium]
MINDEADVFYVPILTSTYKEYERFGKAESTSAEEEINRTLRRRAMEHYYPRYLKKQRRRVKDERDKAQGLDTSHYKGRRRVKVTRIKPSEQ